VDLDEARRAVLPGAQRGERPRHLLLRPDEHVAELERLLHRRLDAVEDELVGGLLGEVDDVVERGRQAVAGDGVERRARRAAARRRGGG
jgi:hypothetical protein